jgi:hypothetical protein
VGRVMPVDRETVFTDYDWRESDRPILVISAELDRLALYKGGTKSMVDLPAIEHSDFVSVRDLVSVLEGYRDIFESAAKWAAQQELRGEKGETEACHSSY